jgi:hypothetical protein
VFTERDNLQVCSTMKLIKALDAWGSPSFDQALKQELQGLDHAALPLQQGLAQSSMVSDSAFSVVILQVTETEASLLVKAGIFYNGIIAGSCCADDPTPVCEENEYCEVQLDINKTTAQTNVTLLPT